MPPGLTAPALALALHGPSPEETAELGRRAEAVGVGRLLVSDQPGGPDPFAVAAFVLASTERIAVGPGLVSALDRHPLLLARQAATLDQIAPGRALLGLGRTSRKYVEGLLGLPYQPATERMEEVLTLVHLLLAGGRVDFRGSIITLIGAELESPPAAPIPVLLGASGGRTIRVGGERADGVLLNGGATPEFVAWARGVAEAAAAASGRDPTSLEIGTWCLAAVERNGRWTPELSQVRRQLVRYLIEPDSGRVLIQRSGLDRPSRQLLLTARSAGPAALEEALRQQDLLSQLTVLGSAEECLSRLARYQRAGSAFLVLQPAALEALTGM